MYKMVVGKHSFPKLKYLQEEVIILVNNYLKSRHIVMIVTARI